MKKSLPVVLVLMLFLPICTYSHEEGQEFNLDHSGIYPLSQLSAVGYGSLGFGILIAIIFFFRDRMNQLAKKIFYALIFIITLLTTLYLVITTVQLNTMSSTRGPVHWHADFEILACGKEIKLAEPKGMSNKQGTNSLHSHDDSRIHVEGVLLDRKEASLGAVFHAVNGALYSDGITVPTDNGLVSFHDGDKCNETPAKLYVFVNGKLVENPSYYVISPYEKVPPGDQIRFVFTEKAVEEINPNVG